MRIDRRDFLALKPGRPAELSCERLYMRFLDARLQGTTARLFDVLREDLAKTDSVPLSEPSWLSDTVLQEQLETVLGEFRRRGGRVGVLHPGEHAGAEYRAGDEPEHEADDNHHDRRHCHVRDDLR